MNNHAAFLSNRNIDLQASAARRAAARRLAADQADLVASCDGGASKASIDLLFLLQESVLVFDETHVMLTTLAAAEPAPGQAAKPAAADRGVGDRSRTRMLVAAAHVVAFLAIFAAATMLIEIVDPAPLEVQAVGFGAPLPTP